ncbi:MAG: ChbG/HpnK family deacetylase [Dermatophilaceae bacterium]|jgi:predicted glycoside hydrolase/deacetylase ChbG (UPF0249 family)
MTHPVPGRRLVVNADDLGLTKGVNRAIRKAHLEGIVTSTSLLTVARHHADAISMLEATPTLAAGLHLALVGEDPPVLSAREVPTLVDRRGHFPLGYRAFVARAATGRVDPADIRRELDAQIQVATSAGLSLSHLDSHQHVHLWPSVARVVIDLARTHGIGQVRLPRAHGRGPIATGVNVLSSRLAARLRRADLPRVPYAGLDEAGAMDEAALRRAFAALGSTQGPVAEVNVHPGELDEESPRFDWGYRWEDELAALIGATTRADVTAAGFVLGPFTTDPSSPAPSTTDPGAPP